MSPDYSIDLLCERFRAIELRKELRTTKGGGTSEDPVVLFAKQKGSRAHNLTATCCYEGSIRSQSSYYGLKTERTAKELGDVP